MPISGFHGILPEVPIKKEQHSMSASAILKLQTAGFSTEQVTALADLIDTQAASKSDVEGAEHRLTTKMGELEHRIDTKMGELEHRLELKIEQVKADVLLLKWMMGFILAFQVAIFFKLFMQH